MPSSDHASLRIVNWCRLSTTYVYRALSRAPKTSVTQTVVPHQSRSGRRSQFSAVAHQQLHHFTGLLPTIRMTQSGPTLHRYFTPTSHHRHAYASSFQITHPEHLEVGVE